MPQVETITMDYELLKSRSSYKVWLTFKVNRFELATLLQIRAYSIKTGKDIFSRSDFVQYLSRNKAVKAKVFGALQGLLRLKCIGMFEYVYRPGSQSLGISTLGLKVMEVFYQELKRLNRQQTARFAKSRKAKKPMKYRPIEP